MYRGRPLYGSLQAFSARRRLLVIHCGIKASPVPDIERRKRPRGCRN